MPSEREERANANGYKERPLFTVLSFLGQAGTRRLSIIRQAGRAKATGARADPCGHCTVDAAAQEAAGYGREGEVRVGAANAPPTFTRRSTEPTSEQWSACGGSTLDGTMPIRPNFSLPGPRGRFSIITLLRQQVSATSSREPPEPSGAVGQASTYR